MFLIDRFDEFNHIIRHIVRSAENFNRIKATQQDEDDHTIKIDHTVVATVLETLYGENYAEALNFPIKAKGLPKDPAEASRKIEGLRKVEEKAKSKTLTEKEIKAEKKQVLSNN